MSERSDPVFSDDELERQLRLLARSIAFPATPDIATSISAELRAQPISLHQRRRWMTPVIIAAAVVALLIGGSLALFPSTRHAVAGWFDLPGISIFVSDTPPTPGPSTPEPVLESRYGPSRSLGEAAAAMDFPILLPDHAVVTEPGKIYLSNASPTVLLVAYAASEQLPDAAQSGTGLLIVEFRSESEAVWAMKQVGAATEIKVVRVNGGEALWIGGAHQLMIVADTIAATPVSRESANVLAWSLDGVTYRLEADLPLETMIAIAESMQPAT